MASSMADRLRKDMARHWSQKQVDALGTPSEEGGDSGKPYGQ